MNEQFIWADAWILLAIIYAGENGSLATISHIADGIDHSIPTQAELDGAFRRLGKARYIEAHGDKYRATPVVIEAFEKTHTPRRDVSKELGDVKRFLGVGE